ncbi:MAG: molecular chaperone HtpG, partial [Candidatus Omnitrophica bacterium]|nr:molecular chaperone HtpG [Candidatus Omnitrophota bacterium]
HMDKNFTGCRWKSSAGTFTIEEITRPERGTKIFFKLKDEHKEFAEVERIKEIITKYSNFADFPIYLGKDKINKVEALWRKKASELKENEVNEFYKFIANDYEEPLAHIPVSVEGSVVSFKALLFIPKTAPFDLMRKDDLKTINLYSNKILIQSNCREILPEYLRFIRGVVDTIDLPLNVSRELTQASPLMTRIKNILISKIFVFLEDLFKKDREKYLVFYRNFGPLFKTGLNSDFENKDKITDLLCFVSSRTKENEMVTLKEYAMRVKPDQKEIYYISGDSRDSIERNPNLEYFRKNDIEVLFLIDPVDIFTVPSIGEFDTKKIKSIEKADIELKAEDKLEKPDSNLSKSLIDLFKKTLKDKVEDVVESKRLVDSAVTLVSGKNALDPQMEKMMKIMTRDNSYVSKKTLEVNMAHPLLKNLSQIYLANTHDVRLEKCILQLYESALFIDGSLPPNSDFVKRMTDLMVDATR